MNEIKIPVRVSRLLIEEIEEYNRIDSLIPYDLQYLTHSFLDEIKDYGTYLINHKEKRYDEPHVINALLYINVPRSFMPIVNNYKSLFKPYSELFLLFQNAQKYFCTAA